VNGVEVATHVEQVIQECVKFADLHVIPFVCCSLRWCCVAQVVSYSPTRQIKAAPAM
jgi:hypothetical protein